MKKIAMILGMAMLLAVCRIPAAGAETGMLTWTGSSQYTDGTLIGPNELAGHRLYWGATSGNYTHSAVTTRCFACPDPSLLPTESECVALQPGETRCWVVTSFDIYGMESDFSNEVCHTAQLSPLSVPLGNVDTLSPGSANRVNGFDLIALLKYTGRGIMGLSCTAENFSYWRDNFLDTFDLEVDGAIDPDDVAILNSNFGASQ